MSNIKLRLENLVIEVTRRCNMACDHCLRGEAQNINIDNKILNEIAKQVDDIWDITFTGGEPSLNTDAISQFLKELKHYNVSLSGFWIATNGKVYNEKFILTLLDYYAYCMSNGGEEDYSCAVTISEDQFHEEIDEENLLKLKALKFYREDRKGELSDRQIVNDGYAKENGIGYKKIDVPTEFSVEKENDVIYVRDLVYINAKGDVLAECDLSYESQTIYKLGNILEKPLADIILEHSNLALDLTA